MRKVAASISVEIEANIEEASKQVENIPIERIMSNILKLNKYVFKVTIIGNSLPDWTFK